MDRTCVFDLQVFMEVLHCLRGNELDLIVHSPVVRPSQPSRSGVGIRKDAAGSGEPSH